MWHNQGVDGDRPARGRRGGGRERVRRAPVPLDETRLRDLAIHYVGRFATTRSKLRDYLRRKLRERGWSGDNAPDLDNLADRLAELGYVDDAAFALAKAGSLGARGYGEGRVRQALHAAGVAEDDGAPARELSNSAAAENALRFARRRRLGPFADHLLDPAGRQRALAAMIRAGHSFALAKAILDCAPGEEPDPDLLDTRNS